jgi:hypothetical protein
MRLEANVNCFKGVSLSLVRDGYPSAGFDLSRRQVCDLPFVGISPKTDANH